MQKFIIAITTLIQPAAVYIFIVKKLPNILNPFSPNGVTAACSPGPTMNPKTCANEIIETAAVRSSIRVAADR